MNYNQLYLFSGYILIILQTVPITVGFIKIKQLNKPLKIFLLFSAIYLFLEIAIRILIFLVYKYWEYFRPFADHWGINDFTFTNILFYINNYCLLGYFFVLVIKQKEISKLIKWSAIFLLGISLFNYLFNEAYKTIGVFNPTADAIFCFVLPCIFMWNLYKIDSIIPLSKNPYYWINLRLIVPNLVAIILHFIGDKIQETDKELFLKISLIKNVIWFIGLIFASIGFYYARYTKFLPQYNSVEEK